MGIRRKDSEPAARDLTAEERRAGPAPISPVLRAASLLICSGDQCAYFRWNARCVSRCEKGNWPQARCFECRFAIASRQVTNKSYGSGQVMNARGNRDGEQDGGATEYRTALSLITLECILLCE